MRHNKSTKRLSSKYRKRSRSNRRTLKGGNNDRLRESDIGKQYFFTVRDDDNSPLFRFIAKFLYLTESQIYFIITRVLDETNRTFVNPNNVSHDIYLPIMDKNDLLFNNSNSNLFSKSLLFAIPNRLTQMGKNYSNSDETITFVGPRIGEDLSAEELQLMLSHAHRDHIPGEMADYVKSYLKGGSKKYTY